MRPYYSAGRYQVEVTDQKLGETKNGNPQFVMQFKVLSRIDPDGGQHQTQQYQRTYFRVINGNTAKYAIEDLKALGFAGTSFSQLDLGSSNCHDFRGSIVEMECKIEPDQNNEDKEAWQVPYAGTGSGLEVRPLEPRKVRELDQLFGKMLKDGAPPPRRQPQPVAAGGGQITDDDIPW